MLRRDRMQRRAYLQWQLGMRRSNLGAGCRKRPVRATGGVFLRHAIVHDPDADVLAQSFGPFVVLRVDPRPVRMHASLRMR